MTTLEAEGVIGLKENYQINRIYAFSHLKRCLPRWLLVMLPSAKQLFVTLLELSKNTIRFVEDATKPRPKHPKPHRKHAYKSTC